MKKNRRTFLKNLSLISGGLLFLSQSKISSVYATGKPVVVLSEIESARTYFFMKKYDLAETLCKQLIDRGKGSKGVYILLRKILKAQNKDLDILNLFYEASNSSEDLWMKDQFQKVLTSASLGNHKAFKKFMNYHTDVIIPVVLDNKEIVKKGNDRWGVYVGDEFESKFAKIDKKIRRDLYFEKERECREKNKNKVKKGALLYQYKKQKQTKNYELALDFAYRAYLLNREDKSVFNIYRNELLKSGKTGEALKLYIDMPVNRNSYWQQMGYAKVMRQHGINSGIKSYIDQAQTTYQYILDRYENRMTLRVKAQVNNGIGICMRELGNYEEAFLHYNSLLKQVEEAFDTGYDEVVIGLANVYLKKNDFDSARLLVEKYLPKLGNKTDGCLYVFYQANILQ